MIQANKMVFDFHTHSFHSDGLLSPAEMVRLSIVSGYAAVAITDHVSVGNCACVLEQLIKDCDFCARHWDILAIPGVELTYVPAAGIAETAKLARECGARIVVVHGESITEHVEPGTNQAAVLCRDVDILAHPGLLSVEEAEAAAANGIFIEISARRGHCLTNGHIVKTGREASVKLLVNSDAHGPADFLNASLVLKVAEGAGLEPGEITQVLEANPRILLSKLGYSPR